MARAPADFSEYARILFARRRLVIGIVGAPGPRGWDTDRWNVEASRMNTAAASRPSGFSDCFTWIASVLEVGVSVCEEPSGLSDKTWGKVKSLFR